MITPELLASFRVLWRRDDTLCLYGVPYLMREAQSPGDIVRARRDQIARNLRLPASMLKGWEPASEIPDDWVWLGTPGWWGTMSRDEQALVVAFLEQHRDVVPAGPYEWDVIPQSDTQGEST